MSSGGKTVSSGKFPVSSEGRAAEGRRAPLTLVIGYGNPLRSDDGVGPWIAGQLEQALIGVSQVTCLTAFQLTPELADDISQVDRVVFIDASVAVRAGEMAMTRVMGRTVRHGALGHEMSPEELMFLCESIFGKAPAAWAIGIGVGSIEFGEGLTAAVAKTAERLVAKLSFRLRRGAALNFELPSRSAAFAPGERAM